MANVSVLNKKAIVTGNPNSPLGLGRKRAYTCTYNSTGTTNTLSGVGPLKNGDLIFVRETQTNAATGYAGILWNTANTVYDLNSGTIGLAPVNASPNANVNLVVEIEDL
jgi:hypothetical protein